MRTSNLSAILNIVLDKVFKQGGSSSRTIMKIATLQSLKLHGVLVLGVFKNTQFFDAELSKEMKTVDSKRFSHKYGEQYWTKVQGHHTLLIGLGEKKELTLEKVRRLMGKVVSAARQVRETHVTTNIPDLVDFDAEKLGMAVAEGLLLRNYAFTKYLDKEKQAKKKGPSTVHVVWSGSGKFASGLKKGRMIAESANYVRDLVNEPASVVNSTYLERAAKEIGKHPKISVTVLNKPELTKLKMGALLGVNAGSKNPPKLIILQYKGGTKRPIALVGKGITFDTGGYNLKPTKYIEDMHTDMAGAAAVLGTIKAVAALGVKKNLIGVMAVCENMVSRDAQHPGDIVKAYNGKTIMIGNTDAEGRLVLADALAYTQKKYNPAIIVDLATLTGACVVALGYYTAAAIGKDEKLLEELKSAGEASGDRVWPMPFYDDYQDWMDGSVTDLNNIAQKGKGFEAGSITAGVFLSKFLDLDKCQWAHLDIAGSAHWNITNDIFSKGATGSGVRILSYWLM